MEDDNSLCIIPSGSFSPPLKFEYSVKFVFVIAASGGIKSNNYTQTRFVFKKSYHSVRSIDKLLK